MQLVLFYNKFNALKMEGQFYKAENQLMKIQYNNLKIHFQFMKMINLLIIKWMFKIQIKTLKIVRLYQFQL